MIAHPNTQDVSRAAVIQSVVVPCWKPGRGCGRFAGGVLVTSSLHFPQTNRILLVHVQQNGDIPSTKEVRVMSACTISGNATPHSARGGKRLVCYTCYTALYSVGPIKA